MTTNSFAAFVPNGHGIPLSRTQFIPHHSCHQRRTAAPHRRSRIQPTALVYKGRIPNPIIPETLFDAAPIMDIERNKFDFSTLKGQIVYMVNVASNDSHTEENYNMMSALHDKYHGSGLEILAYPSNWYGQKETGSYEEIKEFVTTNWGDKFHIMGKVDLEMDQAFALGCKYFPGEIIWNFHGKFLFNRQGIPVERFDLLTTADYIQSQIERVLLDAE